MATVIITAKKVIRKLEKTMEEDEKQFNRHIVVENYKAKEKVFNKIDTRAVKDVATALKDLAAVVSMKNGEESNQNNVEVVFKEMEDELNE